MVGLVLLVLILVGLHFRRHLRQSLLFLHGSDDVRSVGGDQHGLGCYLGAVSYV